VQAIAAILSSPSFPCFLSQELAYSSVFGSPHFAAPLFFSEWTESNPFRIVGFLSPSVSFLAFNAVFWQIP